MKFITVEEKIQMIEQRMRQLERELYNNQLTLKIFDRAGESEPTKQAMKINVQKQEIAMATLEEELEPLKQLINAPQSE